MSNESNESSGFKPEFRLFIKGPLIKNDKQSKFGEDIFSHRFMFIMAKKEIPNAKMIPVDPVYKKDILAKYGVSDTSLKIPFIQHLITEDIDDAIIRDDPHEMETYLEAKFQPQMRPSEPAAVKVPLNVFQKFMFYFKTEKGSNDEQTKLNALNGELKGINKFLSENGRKFLCGDTITLPDCNLLPKLHYIRVAGWHYKQFEFPEDFPALRRYLEDGDEDDSFTETKCMDKEIIEGFKKYVR